MRTMRDSELRHFSGGDGWDCFSCGAGLIALGAAIYGSAGTLSWAVGFIATYVGTGAACALCADGAGGSSSHPVPHP